MTSIRAAWLLSYALLGAGCGREAAPEVETGEPASPERAAGPRVSVNGHAIAIRTVRAASRGGEAVHVLMSSAPDRDCAALSGDGAVALGTDEVLIALTLAQPLFETRGHEQIVSDHPRWQVVTASWPGGIWTGSEAPGVVEMPDDLATAGGRLRLRLDASFQVGAASPKADLALHGEFEVAACGDLSGAKPAAPLSIDVRVGKRRLPIRSAFALNSERGRQLELRTSSASCDDRRSKPVGDVAIVITLDGERSQHVFVHGDLVSPQINLAPGDYTVRADGEWTGTGKIELTVDGGAGSYAPISVHGRVPALRCNGG